MSKFLNDLSAGVKIPYQTYTLEHGIERLRLAVPCGKSALFESKFAGLSSRSKSSVVSLVQELGGKVLS